MFFGLSKKKSFQKTWLLNITLNYLGMIIIIKQIRILKTNKFNMTNSKTPPDPM